jgi:hypothetical protein
MLFGVIATVFLVYGIIKLLNFIKGVMKNWVLK